MKESNKVSKYPVGLVRDYRNVKLLSVEEGKPGPMGRYVD